ncbi:MAG: hypothetical protein IKO99_05885 [Bacteroidales bacterium]|nr:hypothetical protein [Bacteroidales bacterium]MBR4677515.1 hypothetical protein [Bacteroidales bacterium]
MILSAKKYCGYLLATSIFLSACAGNAGGGKKTDVDTSKKEQTAQLDPNKSAIVKINNRLFSVPSPLQLAGFLKELNLPFKKELLSDASARQNYTTSFKQALNTGVYGADLGYINAYDQLPEAAAYFSAVRFLTSELGILNSFNEETISRIEKNSGDKDSLLYIASLIYRESDYYLTNSDRNEIGALIIAGGWAESLYLMTNAGISGGNTKKLCELICEQKYPLNNLIELLRPYYGKLGNVNYDTFLENLSDLAGIFDEINVKYTFRDTKTDENKRLTVINSESNAALEDAQIEVIRTKITKLRNEIIQ